MWKPDWLRVLEKALQRARHQPGRHLAGLRKHKIKEFGVMVVPLPFRSTQLRALTGKTCSSIRQMMSIIYQGTAGIFWPWCDALVLVVDLRVDLSLD